MTTSKMWALIISLILVGGAIIGGLAWRQSLPESSEFGALVDPLIQKLPALPKPGAPAKLGPDEEAARKAAQSVTPKATDRAASDKAASDKPAPDKAASDKAASEMAAAGQTDTAAIEPPKAEAPIEPPKVEPPSGAGQPPHFDVVRVEPSGETVVAGKGDPNAKVALVESGKVVAEAKTDAGGNFVIIPPTLKPGDHDLTLRQSADGKPAEGSKQAVAVSVPRKSGDQVIVALAEPGKPTKLLSEPPAAPAPGTANAPKPADQTPAGAKVAVAKPEMGVAPPAAVAPKGPDLAFRTVELEGGNGFYATGVATPGTKIELYLNEAHLAAVVAGKDGQWSVTIKRGLSGGHYRVRADAFDGSKVTARVEVPFDVPVAVAEAPKVPKAPEKPKPPEKPKVSIAPAVEAPGPYSAPSPSEVAGLGPEPSLAGPSDTDIQPVVPTPRPDIAAAAKAAVADAPKKAPPTLAMAPPASSSAPNAVPAPAPPAAARAPQVAVKKMAVAPPKPADAPPVIAATKPAVTPPKRAEVAAAVGAKPAVAKPVVVQPAAPAPAAAPATPKPPQVATASPAPDTESKPTPDKPAPVPDASNAVIEQIETAFVIRGDNLWNISRARLGNATRYTQIYAANADQIRDPSLIYPGQVFVMPQK